MDIQVKGTSIECSFKRMLVLDTWLSIKDSKSELERWRRVFQALLQLLPDIENFVADDLEKRVTNLCTRFVTIWKQVARNHSRMVSMTNREVEEVAHPTTETLPEGFFSNSAISAEITGLDKDLIDRCHNLLQCLSSGYKINNAAVKEYALDTAHKLVAAYSWYNLPSSVHKVLIHGSEVIDHSIPSIGELSEEAAESANKLVKQFRRDNMRKMSRIVTNTDLIHRLLLNSNSYISSLRRLPRKKKSILSKDALNLLSV